ncbi:hypothetical protein LTR84_001658 [Exophiala bonariae]|uniref:Cytochrome P450 monooxygenase n=1 Tax=Exophiala bonariae TaxID=1690606 RepID=A0AAV9NEM8_9EURO|nr:hypothetical protein LTR84_001658 [Exophiala bonariae]
MSSFTRVVANQVLLLFIVIVCGYFLYYILLSPLSPIPGPVVAKLTRLWLAFEGYRGTFHTTLLSLHDEYGDVVRVGPNELSIVEPGTVKMIYGIGSKFSKSDWYEPSRGARRFDLFAQQSERIHRTQRRVVNNIYTTASLRDSESAMDVTISRFMDVLENRCRGPIDLGKWLQLFAFDVIGQITFSRSFGLLELGHETPVLKAIFNAQKSASWVNQIPWAYRIHEAVIRPLFGERLAATARNGSIRSFVLDLIQARNSQENVHEDLMGKLEKVHKRHPAEFEKDDIVSMAATNVFAGSDTTAISMRAIFDYVLRDVRCKKTLVEEVDKVFSENQITSTAKYPVMSFAQASRMPYLQAVMYEAMRLHPVVGQTLPRVVPPEGLLCGDFVVPKDTIVGTSPYVLGRSKKIFGPDAEKFRPERWFDAHEGTMHRFWYAFGAGSRTCIGKSEPFSEALNASSLTLISQT